MTACAVLPYEVVFNGTSGVIEYVLLDDDEPLIDLSAVNRIVFKIGDTDIDSNNVATGIINWTNTADYYGQTVNVVRAQLGGQGLVAGDYSGSRMTVYDPANPLGVVWSTTLNIRVED